MANCLEIPPLPPNTLATDTANGTSSVLKALGVESCKTGQAGGLSLLPPGFIGGTTSVGCGQVQVQANAVETALRQTACILNRQNITSSSSVDASNKISINTAQGSTICNITADQKNVINAQIANSFTVQATNDVKSAMKTMTEQLGKASADQTNGYLGTAQGQQVVQNFTSYTTQDATVSSINDWTQQALNDVSGENGFTLNVGPYSTVGAVSRDANGCIGGVNINQENLATLQAQTVIDNVLTNIFSTDQGAAYKSALTSDLKSVSEGAGSIIPSFGTGIIAVIVIAIIGGLIYFGRNSFGWIFKWILPILILISIGVAVYFGYNGSYTNMGITIGLIVLLFAIWMFTLFYSFEKPKRPKRIIPPSPVELTTMSTQVPLHTEAATSAASVAALEG